MGINFRSSSAENLVPLNKMFDGRPYMQSSIYDTYSEHGIVGMVILAQRYTL